MLSINDIEPKEGEVWHPWWLLEEVKHNMWGDVSRKRTWLQIAIAFTGDHELYGEWMKKVAEQWQHSCEHNLTKPGDKRPWIGHAAVALAIGCPEDIVREAWGHLSEEQQVKANAKASEAIEYWRNVCQKKD
jgi:hypothetical protein